MSTNDRLYFEYVVPLKITSAFDKAMLDFSGAKATKRYAFNWHGVIMALLAFDIASTMIVLSFLFWLVFVHF